MLDVGSNYGWYSRLICEANPDVQVVAFECNPRTFEFLRRNTQDLPRVRVMNVGVGARDEDGTVYCATASGLSSTVRKVGEPMSIRLRSLDSMCSELGIAEVDLVKCDVEGAELAVVEGARRLME